MKSLQFLSHIILLALIVGFSATAARAQTTNAPAADSTTAVAPSASQPPAPLTQSERTQLARDRQNVLAANPDLKAEGDNLKMQADALKSQGASATPADKAALKAQAIAHEKNMRAAMLALDPTLAPVYAKLDALHKSK